MKMRKKVDPIKLEWVRQENGKLQQEIIGRLARARMHCGVHSVYEIVRVTKEEGSSQEERELTSTFICSVCMRRGAARSSGLFAGVRKKISDFFTG